MSADARMMTSKQVAKWAADEFRTRYTRQAASNLRKFGSAYGLDEVAETVYHHKIARVVMVMQGYIDKA